MSDIKPQIQEAQRTPTKKNVKKTKLYLHVSNSKYRKSKIKKKNLGPGQIT